MELLRNEVERFNSAGDIPLDLLMEKQVPTGHAAEHEALAAGQSEEPAATMHSAEEIIQLLRNPVVPQSKDLEI